MTDPVPRWELPIDWEAMSPEQRHKFFHQERRSRQAARQESVSPEARADLKETTVFCTTCGEEHTTMDTTTLNYCRACGGSL